MNALRAKRPPRFAPDIRDLAFALGLAVVGVGDLLTRRVFLFDRHGPLPPPVTQLFQPQHSPTVLSYALILAAFLPLALRRRFPLWVLAAATLAAGAYQLAPNPPSLVFVAPLVALYTVGVERDRMTLILAGSAAACTMLVATLPGSESSRIWADLVRVVAMLGVAGAIGDGARTQRAYIAEVEQRAVEAERGRDEEAKRRVDEERLRIARELHDVVAHSLSIIAVQSGAASHVIATDPAEAKRSLDAIRRTSKEALDELRAMLGVLRTESDADVPLAPVPGIERLEDLVRPLRDAGFDVTVSLEGELGGMPALVEVSVYRLVQEALTNVVRHAGVCSVRVTVSRTDGSVAVSVEDDGRGLAAAPPHGGHGLAGMRERVTALGGTFEAGPRSGGGFRVAATLPLGQRGSAS